MTSRKQRLQQRNKLVRDFFKQLEEKNLQWKLSALLDETANRFPPISSATVSAILKQTGTYAD